MQNRWRILLRFDLKGDKLCIHNFWQLSFGKRHHYHRTAFLDALQEQSKVHLKLGTLAIHEGYMTAGEVYNIIIMQTHQDKKFGELAIEEGYLTEEQVNALLEAQKPDYLLLGKALIEKGILTNTQFENILDRISV